MDNVQEMLEKMGPDFFNRKLQDEVKTFQELMSTKGNDLSKKELKRLLEFAVRLPDIDDIHISPNMKELCEVIAESKCTGISLTLQTMMAHAVESQQEQTAPAYKGE